jgi:hypothetical protein
MSCAAAASTAFRAHRQGRVAHGELMSPETVAACFRASLERSSGRSTDIAAGTQARPLLKPLGIDAAIKTIDAQTFRLRRTSFAGAEF